MSVRTALSLTALASFATARDIPDNVRAFYDKVTSSGECANPLASGFHSLYGGGDGFSYCGDAQQSNNVVYISGPSNQLTNMDVCCDGIQDGPADDGRCETDPSLLSITAFQYLVEGYGTGQRDLDANAHPYVVFGNTGDTPGWPTFNPRDHGIEPLSVMAVVCGDKLFYGVWGDMNGDDGENAMVGEASIALATACFGKEMNGNFGYDGNDVLYVAFPGSEAVPGADGAAWAAQNFEDFEASIEELGNSLIERL